MRSLSDTVKEMSVKSGALPYFFESPLALMIGGKLFGLLPGFGYACRLFSIAGLNLLRGALPGGPHFTTKAETEAGRNTANRSGLAPACGPHGE
jgi:hypothetical protein